MKKENKDPKEEKLDEVNQELLNNAAAEESSEETADKILADIQGLNQEVSDLKDKNLRLMAEFDNFRKRSLKEKGDLIKTASEDVLKQILPLVDDFERALKAMESTDDAASLKEGVNLIYNKLLSFLGENGVQAIPTENVVFDTDLHEAITTFPAPSEDMKGKIVDCVSKGYILNEKVIRFSKVVVGE